MATALGLKNKGLEGSIEVSSDSLSGNRIQYTDVYLVQADNATEKQLDIANATGLPVLRSISDNAWLRRKVPTEIDSAALLWEVACEYDSEIDSENDIQVVEWEWESEDMEEVVWVDQVNGNPIVNAVGEPLITTTTMTIPVLVITRLQDTFSPTVILNYANRVNSTAFWGAPPGTALMEAPRDRHTVIDGLRKRRVTYRIKFNLNIDPFTSQPKGWMAQPLNHGTKYLLEQENPFTGNPEFVERKFLTDDGKDTTGNLNLDGTPRPIDQPPTYMQYNRYRTANFNALQLGPF